MLYCVCESFKEKSFAIFYSLTTTVKVSTRNIYISLDISEGML